MVVSAVTVRPALQARLQLIAAKAFQCFVLLRGRDRGALCEPPLLRVMKWRCMARPQLSVHFACIKCPALLSSIWIGAVLCSLTLISSSNACRAVVLLADTFSNRAR
jgi:hypothetical protein